MERNASPPHVSWERFSPDRPSHFPGDFIDASLSLCPYPCVSYHRVLSISDPRQFALVAFIILTIDIATFVGWLQAIRRPLSAPPPMAEQQP